jgi:RNA polymerase sigma-70 factor (sigma-E family)
VDKRQARAFEAFAAESGAELLRIATLLTSDPYLAEDVYQETLQRLAARWSRVDSPRAFCRRVMHNIVIDQSRAAARRPRETRLFPVSDSTDPRSADPHDAVEVRPALFAALDTLTAQQRAIVVLRYFEDRSEADVARLLGVSAGTVKSTASRAMAQLRTHPGLTALFATTDYHTRPAITLTAAQRTLYRLSSAAANATQGQGRYVVMREMQDSYQRTSVIDSMTGDVWTYQQGAGVPAELPVARHDSPTQAQFAAMPTGPAALRGLLISQYDQQQKQADAAMAAQLKQKGKILRRGHRPAIKPLRLTANDKVFEQANLLLWNPLVGPALRSAVFKVLAATPGVQVSSHARDGLGRPAVEISWFDRVTSVTLATFEDPSTTRMLEQTDTAAPAAVNGHTGSTGRDLYLSVTRARAVPPNPYR